MIEKIGEAAGKVWQALQNGVGMSAYQLKKATGADDRTLWMALGWLAREDKIAFVQEKGALKVRLKS